MPADPHPAIQIVDMGDGTIHVTAHVTVYEEDVEALCRRIRAMAGLR
jgi:hypothetical protein